MSNNVVIFIDSNIKTLDITDNSKNSTLDIVFEKTSCSAPHPEGINF
ncbi:hypothetical protein PPL_09158 [Heterostelium album PN500]|uniref:Uncharacterized protein n=1 Tax=Heterostelium pallidum (strain ATCC 26659 / Pp 5 / PN500) TaxID=670386 RepID=D3BKS6_HETP5|nr:hypothetical protein PPL_09158 [Heterostelium album PN500]EFA78506.1 hypothetical protein PPL_09158 [Heterostelium album PN500]|eukprot:XP_020430630.1 hypothetical protein PPL_09158 [Heterostelium album PN500]